ncbi:RHS repeat domain-containing protein [Leptospira sanjuanensis]|uniref:RHS repeat domain-containing protein n=1 Tax=Leptospira sanjuanensis TaxID=2879643 RepID=UPI001EE798D6|nr:RHS repeat-associated core domain-containing protein [Leptospira sanjuanensis]MCG6168927.1 RHS repeat-associated core domain-containing protein [Leptospira sanjuanensis]
MTEAESPVRAYAKETPQYDANGNLTRQRDNAKDLTKRISVDSQDRIVQIQDANNAILGSYWYDEGGFRVRRSALEQKNNQFTNVEILYPSKFYGLEYIESENLVTSVNNVYLNGVRIAALNEAGALAYFLTDQVDSVSHVLDDEGKTLSRMQYLPYGDTFVHKGDTNFAPKYNSQELDWESGFYFYNARYYDPGIARFTSADTIIDGESDTQGWNRFSYVKGNPIGAKDPTGHCTSPMSTVPCKRPLETGPPAGAVGAGRSSSNSNGGYSGGLGAAATGLLANLLGSNKDNPSLPDKPRSTSVTPNDAKEMGKAGLDPLNKSDIKNFLGKGSKSGATHGGNSGINNRKGNVDIGEKSFFDGTKYSNKVLGQMKKGDNHAFPESVKAFEKDGKISKITGDDGITREMLKIQGEYGRNKGNFEFIKENDGIINHRLFRPKSGE